VQFAAAEPISPSTASALSQVQKSGLPPATCREEEEKEEKEGPAKSKLEFPGVETQLLQGER